MCLVTPEKSDELAKINYSAFFFFSQCCTHAQMLELQTSVYMSCADTAGLTEQDVLLAICWSAWIISLCNIPFCTLARAHFLNVLPVASRWGSSVQHSYRKYIGCGAAGGGVFQDEKRKDVCSKRSLCKCLDSPLKYALFSSPPDVPGYSARASTLHPGQQLCGGPWLDRHPHQSQPMQPQTPEHLPSFSLPQWPLAVLQALSRHSYWVHTLHRVHKVVRLSSSIRATLALSLYASVFRGLPANIQLDVDGDRETERIYSLYSTYMTKLIKMQGQTPVWLPDMQICFHSRILLSASSFCFRLSLLQRPVAVNLCTMDQNRRSTPALLSMTPRRLTKP